MKNSEQIDHLISDDQYRMDQSERFDRRVEHYKNILNPLNEKDRIGTLKVLMVEEPMGDELVTELIKALWPNSSYETIYEQVIYD